MRDLAFPAIISTANFIPSRSHSQLTGAWCCQRSPAGPSDRPLPPVWPCGASWPGDCGTRGWRTESSRRWSRAPPSAEAGGAGPGRDWTAAGGPGAASRPAGSQPWRPGVQISCGYENSLFFFSFSFQPLAALNTIFGSWNKNFIKFILITSVRFVEVRHIISTSFVGQTIPICIGS